MPFFSRVFRGKDSSATKKQSKPTATADPTPARPKWTDAWQRTEIAPEEVADLVRGCSQELKARALDVPFLLLPFRPTSDPSAARTFIRNYFNQSFERGAPVAGDGLMQELRLYEPMVLCSVLKWCWSRLPGGIVTWDAYELFKVGEQDSDHALDAFSTFIPLSVDSDARTSIINDFFDLLAAIAAHGKSNGLGGRKLSRYAGWWAFEHSDTGGGFEASYKNWAAYGFLLELPPSMYSSLTRVVLPMPRAISSSLISVRLPRSSNAASRALPRSPFPCSRLCRQPNTPPRTPTLLQVTTTKVVMIVDTVSPTPFSLLRRAKNFEYRDEHWHLQEFSNYDDPVKALTDECLRVLGCISSTNQSSVSSSKQSTSLRDASWSRFEDIGFGGAIDSDPEDEDHKAPAPPKSEPAASLRTSPRSQGGDLGRPTTPSWADFMSSGFADEGNLKQNVTPLLLTPDKMLPPIAATRGMSSQSHKRNLDAEPALEPAELASINTFDLDDSFWWVWITSLSGDEPLARKAVFGRGAAPEPEAGAQFVEKKSFFSFGSRKGTKLNRRKSSAKKVSPIEESYKRVNNQAPQSKSSIGPDQHKRIQAAAAALQRKHREEAEAKDTNVNFGRDNFSTKTNSVLTLQPGIVNEASSAMKWTKNYDKNAYRTAYLSDSRAGMAPPPPPKDPAAVATPLPPSPEPAKKILEEPTPQPEKKGNAKTVVIEDPVESQPKQSLDESNKKLKKKTGNNGFKNMFGTSKKKTTEQPAMKSTGAKEISSVAAARAALEAKAAAAQEYSAPSPPKPAVKKKPVPEKPSTPVAAAPAVPAPAPEKPYTPRQAPESPEQPRVPISPANTAGSGPPQTRHAVEYDALSRVDTNERNAADQEFSKFDQGPLLEQPAFVPDTPATPTGPVHSELPQTPTNGHEEKSQHAPTQAEVMAAEEDRWAQIRKNAAERQAAEATDSARPSEEPEARVSQSERSDEGDTSGEETIESRVARIKARVAELTGQTA
ncbi:hypothetical protein N7509_004759 [Penicillium cosmopolitanum]|uniref:Meiotically up-regulated protein Msb1/Mug8 domain-containing protein n=1 Tax=Penicillium cosmopolitanum TaxID=1131564 RepID=A0A9X0B9D4_9EURO|nr:uncharacterized protein N7509_004759 [Penicillium cosmopolitanum]KAJ5396646.1 hypothetical protein N7509_004759 [Penicillium cosmopolitanum]